MSKNGHGKKNDDFLEKLFGHHDHHHHHGHAPKPTPPKGTNRDDVLVGTERNDHLDGRKGDDQVIGNGGNDKLKGGKGDDVVLGGAGNDKLQGGKDDDLLDGGAGSDRVAGDKGDDRLVYAWQDHLSPTFADLGTKDKYDGGKGDDTLVLRLTYGEAALPAVQADLAAFQAFIAQGQHGHHHHHAPPGEPVSLWGLISLGISGGIVPCGEALALFMLAIQWQRLDLALPLLVAFSIGLASVLVLIGVGIVYARRLAIARWGESDRVKRVARVLPLVGALPGFERLPGT